jgi:signal transduction histidine kinase
MFILPPLVMHIAEGTVGATHGWQSLVVLLAGWMPLFAAVTLGCLGLLAFSLSRLLRQHLRMRQAAAQERERTLFLAEASALFASSIELETTLDTVVRKATEVLGDACVVHLIEDDSPMLRLASAHERTSRERRDLRSLLERHPIRMGHGMAGHVAVTGEPLLVRDYPHSPYALPEYVAELGIRGAIAVPLTARGRVIGVLVSAYLSAERLPGADDLRLAKLLADRAALAIEHARLYRQLEERVEERTRELRVTHQQLLEAERERTISELAAIMAHEIRNPLNVVKTSAYFIRQKVGADDRRLEWYLDLMDKQVDTAARIIQDLVDYGGLPEPSFVPTDLGALVHEVADELSVAEEVELRVRVSSGGAEVLCDASQIRRALKNLMLNALHAVGDRGLVRVTVHPDETLVAVDIHDSGARLDETEAERIFDPLFNDRTRNVGLGMALTRRIFEENGGGVTADVHEGDGATFRAWLPRVSRPAAASTAPALPGEDPADEAGLPLARRER